MGGAGVCGSGPGGPGPGGPGPGGSGPGGSGPGGSGPGGPGPGGSGPGGSGPGGSGPGGSGPGPKAPKAWNFCQFICGGKPAPTPPERILLNSRPSFLLPHVKAVVAVLDYDFVISFFHVQKGEWMCCFDMGGLFVGGLGGGVSEMLASTGNGRGFGCAHTFFCEKSMCWSGIFSGGRGGNFVVEIRR